MRKIPPKILEQFQMELELIGYKYKNYLLEWNHVNHILENEILPILFDLVDEEFKNFTNNELKLRSKLNQLTFSNDPDRDTRIIELFNQGLSRGKIAKEVGMSKWGVSKALRRLGVN